MAESAIAGLFQTPEMYQQARQQAQQQQQQQLAAQYAQMAPMQRAAYGSFMTGQQLGAGLGQLLGAEDPQLRMITQQQQILRQIDPNNPDSLAKGAQMAAQMGNNNLASMLATRAREAAANLALIQQRTEEKKTPEQRNAEAISNLQQQIASISALPEDTPGRAAALQSFTGQLTTLQGLTAKAPAAQPKEIVLAKELALLSGPEGSAQYNTAYATALKDQTTARENKLPSMVEEYKYAQTPDGGAYKGSYLDFVNSRAIAGRPPAAAPAPGALTTITDPTDPTKTIVVQSGVYRGGGVGSPGVIGAGVKETGAAPLSAKERQTREATYPKATLALKSFESEANSFTKDLMTLASHPGLSGITGVIYGRTPSLTKDAREAQALYDKIAAKGGFQALQNLRQSSPTGGALGNVSNQEGRQLQQSFAAIDRTQDASSVKNALLRAAEETAGSVNRVKEAYDLTYEYRSPTEQARPTGSWGRATVESK
jgi:hypothetical protein